MRELDYQPNLSARRLRSNETKKPAIAFFWPIDYRTNILASLLNAFQNSVKLLDFDCELIVQTYENDHIDQHIDPYIKNNYNAILIGAASEKDLSYLETLPVQIPSVLINRTSEKYSTICIDPQEIARMAVRLLQKKGYKEAAILASSKPYEATGQRTQAFLEECRRSKILIRKEWILHDIGSIEGGARAAEAYSHLPDRPHCLFCEMDSMALGAAYTLNREHLHAPEDYELLSIGMLEPSITKYTSPPISVIFLPNSKVMSIAVDMIVRSIRSNKNEPEHILIQPELVLRESFTLTKK